MPNQCHCNQCGAKLTEDEKAVCLKLISRTTNLFLCLHCLADRLGCTADVIQDYIKYLRESGNCVLFR